MIEEVQVLAVAGCQPSAARADKLRRAGRLDEALEVARASLRVAPDRLDARLALALVQLDRGCLGDARAELEWLLVELDTDLDPAEDSAALALDDGLEYEEIERAVDNAQIDRESMLDAHRIAEHVLDRALVGEESESQAPPPLKSSAFHTETMASLLERQGDISGARAIRERVRNTRVRGADPEPATSRRERTMAILEGWLANLRRGPA